MFLRSYCIERDDSQVRIHGRLADQLDCPLDNSEPLVEEPVLAAHRLQHPIHSQDILRPILMKSHPACDLDVHLLGPQPGISFQVEAQVDHEVVEEPIARSGSQGRFEGEHRIDQRQIASELLKRVDDLGLASDLFDEQHAAYDRKVARDMRHVIRAFQRDGARCHNACVELIVARELYGEQLKIKFRIAEIGEADRPGKSAVPPLHGEHRNAIQLHPDAIETQVALQPLVGDPAPWDAEAAFHDRHRTLKVDVLGCPSDVNRSPSVAMDVGQLIGEQCNEGQRHAIALESQIDGPLRRIDTEAR